MFPDSLMRVSYSPFPQQAEEAIADPQSPGESPVHLFGERRAALNARAVRVGLGLVIPCLVLVLWYACAAFSLVSPVILPSPVSVVERLAALTQNGELQHHVGVSMFRLVIGLGLGAVFGVATGLATATSALLDKLLSPLFRFLTPVPVLAWMPLVVLFLGTGEVAKIVLMAVGAFFVLFSTTYGAVRAIDPDYIEVARILGKPRSVILRRVVFPSALPAIIEGLRGALALSWIVLVAAEMVASQSGLGWLLWDARTFGRTTDAYVAIIIVGLLGLLGDILVQVVRNRIVRWRDDFQGL